MMFCRMVLVPRKKKAGTVPVYLNVYDLTPINGFGAHEHATTGVFEVEPKHCPGFRFRKSVLVGRTDLGPKEARSFMEKLAEEYSGNTYQLITRNCNHFCNDVCLKLTGEPIPSWVNRLARLVKSSMIKYPTICFLCNCVLPAELNETIVCQVRSEDRVHEGDKKLQRHQSSSSLPSSLQTCPPDHKVKKTRQSRCLPQHSSLLHSSSTSSLPLNLC